MSSKDAIIMDTELTYVLGANDTAVMEDVRFGRFFRPLALFTHGVIFALLLLEIFSGPNLFTCLILVAILAGTLLHWPSVHHPYCGLIGNEVTVSIDDCHLAYSLGGEMLEIPWQYFKLHGSVVETDDHFYFRARLGNIYLPKRAFEHHRDIESLRRGASVAVGARYVTEHSAVKRRKAGYQTDERGVLNLAGLNFQRQFRTRLSSTLSRSGNALAIHRDYQWMVSDLSCWHLSNDILGVDLLPSLRRSWHRQLLRGHPWQLY